MNKVQRSWPTIKRLLAYGKPYQRLLSFAIVLLWIAAGAEVCGPMLVGYFIDNYVAKGFLPLLPVVMLAVGFVLLQLIAAGLHFWQAILFNRAAVGVVQQLRIDVMEAALRQPLKAFDTQPVGMLISRVTNDTEVVKDLYITVVSTVLRSIALISAMLVAMFSMDWRMASIAIMIFPAVLIVMAVYQVYSTPVVRKVRGYLAEINDGFNEAIMGMAVVQQFRQQKRFAERLANASEMHYQARMTTLKLEGFLLRPLLSLFSAVILCALMLLFGFSPVGSIEIGVLYAFINYLGRLNEPLIALTSQQSILQQSMVAGERIFELMDQQQQQYGDDQHPLQEGAISIRSLNFAYRQQEYVLRDITLEVPARGFVALVGHTGSGKSTLANLLMGYYPWQKGEILLDGRSLMSLSHATLREGIAMVQQDPVVLADSVLANITLGREINDSAVWDALEKVQLADLVRKMPQGLASFLGEQGNNLSVGQKQLLALARVLVAAPKILILDEATANIDSGTEQAIQNALLAIRKSTTLVVIAHRLSTIVDADKILVLHHGKAVEQGDHQQLLELKGRYYQMYQLQLAGQKLSVAPDTLHTEQEEATAYCIIP